MSISSIELARAIIQEADKLGLSIDDNLFPAHHADDADVIFLQHRGDDKPLPYQIRISDDGFSLVDTTKYDAGELDHFEEIGTFDKAAVLTDAAEQTAAVLKERLS